MRRVEIDGDLADLAVHASEAESLLKALSNRNRLMILCALSEGELSVTALNERVPLSQSALSQHLATLRRGGMVATRRESQTIYYRLDDPKVGVIIEALHGMFCGAPD
jgi:DNA-binding transcriptional ArsR family regulator